MKLTNHMKTNITKTLSPGDQRLKELQDELHELRAKHDGHYDANKSELAHQLEDTIADLLEARQTHDFEVSSDGSIFLLRPLHPRAHTHIDQNLQSDAQWFGPAVAVEHRYIVGLVDQLRSEGFRVR